MACDVYMLNIALGYGVQDSTTTTTTIVIIITISIIIDSDGNRSTSLSSAAAILILCYVCLSFCGCVQFVCSGNNIQSTTWLSKSAVWKDETGQTGFTYRNRNRYVWPGYFAFAWAFMDGRIDEN